jgi:putative salt-induced outer membrane protein YdiY
MGHAAVLASAAAVVWIIASPAAVIGQTPTPTPLPATIEQLRPSQRVRITFDTGEVLRGTFGGRRGESLILEHPLLGPLEIPLARVSKVEPEAIVDATKTATQTPAPTPPSHPWRGGLDFGLNGAEGNTERLYILTSAFLTQSTPRRVTRFSLYYGRSTDFGEVSEDNLYVNGRNDWLFAGSPWFLFVLGGLEYDVFQLFDVRFTAATGPGYRLLATERTTLNARVGFGGKEDVGGPQNGVEAEALAGFDFWRQLGERQSLYADASVFPTLSDPGEYRIRSRAGYEMLVDPSRRLALSLGVEDRYDSTPDGIKKNDLKYFSVLGWRF